MRVRGARHCRISLPGQAKIVGELTAPCDQSRVFGARQRLANKAEFSGLFGHRCMRG
jgi:hypothetical protein